MAALPSCGILFWVTEPHFEYCGLQGIQSYCDRFHSLGPCLGSTELNNHASLLGVGDVAQRTLVDGSKQGNVLVLPPTVQHAPAGRLLQ